MNFDSAAAVLGNPQGCATWLSSSGVVEGVTVVVANRTASLVMLDLAFDPPPKVHLPGYPAERASIVVNELGDLATVPADDGRSWAHRYPRMSPLAIASCSATMPIPLNSLLGGLCMWYSRDPEYLRWTWSKGFDDYVRIVQRHLRCEEYQRRHRAWPLEDAPHGESLDGRPHPIRTTTHASST